MDGVFVQQYRQVIGESFPVPLIDLILIGPTERIPLVAMVDSGAYRPIFPKKAAEMAGIELSNCYAGGVQYGGSVTSGKIARVKIELIPNGPILDTSILFVDEFQFPYFLLGRIGFFDRFNEVAFIQKPKPGRVELRR
jgi:hypothetical protein